MNKMRMALVALVVLIVAVAGGYLWGAWGRWDVERRLRNTEVIAGLAEARAALYAARVDVAELNFGRAGGNIDRARKTMEALAGKLDETDRADAARAVREAVAIAGQAQQSAASMDQATSGRVAEVLKSLARVDAPAQQ